MAHDRDALVWLNGQVEVAEDGLLARGVLEPQVLEFNTAVRDVLYACLLGVDLRRFFNNAEDQFGGLARLVD